MQFINPFGVEVDIPVPTWALLCHDRPHEALKYSRADLGHDTTGPKDRALYLLFENGIGDVIHSMPAIRAKIESGIHVAVGCNPDQAPFYKRLGCEIIEEYQPSLGIIQKYWNSYGRIHSLRHWCRTHDELSDGDVKTPRFEQFSGYIQSQLPGTFDWRQYLLSGDVKPPVSDIVLGLDSTSAQRGYPQHRELYDELNARHFTVRSMGLPGKGAEYTETHTMDGLMALIDGARTVVAVDAGVLAIALALGKPVVALMGPTSDGIIIGQFSIYRSMDDVRIIRSSLTDPRCARPCNFSGKRGFDVGGKCRTQGDCMREIQVSTILSTLEDLWQKTSSQPRNRITTPIQIPHLAPETPQIPTSVKASTKRGSGGRFVSKQSSVSTV